MNKNKHDEFWFNMFFFVLGLLQINFITGRKLFSLFTSSHVAIWLGGSNYLLPCTILVVIAVI